MKISVIILTRDRLPELRRAYESVCLQTRKPDEVIIVDDFSEVPITCGYVQDLNQAEIDTRVLRVPERKRQAFPPQRGKNFGAENAAGDILMFLDDDDLFEQDKIASQADIFENNDVGLVYTGKKVVYENNPDKIVSVIKPGIQGNIYPDILLGNLIGAPSAIAVTKRLFDEVGGFDERIPAWDDWDFYIRCSRVARVMHDGRCNIRYSVPSTGLTRYKKTKYQRRINAYKYFTDKYKSEINGLPENKRKEIHSNCNFSIAKSARKVSVLESLPFILKSFAWKPRLKPLLLLLPLPVLRFLKGDLH